MTDTEIPLSAERADLLAALRQARFFLRNTTRDLTDEQAAQRSTVSQLTLGGLIKHVADTEDTWCRFIVEGPSAFPDWHDQSVIDRREASFRMQPGETLAQVLTGYEQVARRTDDLLAALPDLDATHPLPEAPWFPPGAVRSARGVLIHIVAETTQHAGHADIIREAIDGAKSMG